MEISVEELQSIIDKAVEQALNKIKPRENLETREGMSEADILKVFNNDLGLSDDELLYYSTPYYDELQEIKNKKLNKENEV